MSDLFSSKTFGAAPWLEITKYDSTGALPPEVVDLVPPVVSRPHEIKFTKDKSAFAVVTDYSYVGPVTDLGVVETPNRVLTMSKNGKTVAVFANAKLDMWVLKKGKHVKANDDLAITNVLAISPDGTFIAISGGTDIINVYRQFGGVFVLDHAYAGRPGFGVVIAGTRMVWWSATLGLRQADLISHVEATVAGSAAVSAYQYRVLNNDVSPSGKFIGMLVTNVSTGRTSAFIVLALIGGVYAQTGISSTGGGTTWDIPSTPVFNQSETRVVYAVGTTGASGAFGVNIYTYPVGSGGTLGTAQALWRYSSAAVQTVFLSRPPKTQHAPGTPEYDNMALHVSNNGTVYVQRLSWDPSTQSFQTAAGEGLIVSGAPTAAHWLSDLTFLASGAVYKLKFTTGGGPTANNAVDVDALPAYDPGATAGNVLNFVISDDYRYVFYVRNISGTDHLFGGDVSAGTGGRGTQGTWVSLYTATADGFEAADDPIMYPVGYSCKNIEFRGDDGTALNFMLRGGASAAVFGRYMTDTYSTADAKPILKESGKTLVPTLVNSYLEFGPDEYFAATFDYSALDSDLKLYKFSSDAMDYVEKFSIPATFGPLTISTCWDVIIANGDSANPFTLYKREGDTLVLNDLPAMEWPDGLGVAVDLVATEDCSGFIVVTDEGNVVTVEIPPPPEDPEEPPEPPKIVDVLPLFPEPDPELVDPLEPVPTPQIPLVTPVIEIIDEQIVVTYPIPPNEPDPDDPDPLQPSPVIITPDPIPIPPAQKPPVDPKYPPPMPVGQGGGTSGTGLKTPFRGPRASVNISYER